VLFRSYDLDVRPANLAPGLYLVRARIGCQSISYMMRHVRTGMAGTMRLTRTDTPLAMIAKGSIAIVDTIVAELTGYYRSATPISQYTGDYTVVLNAKPAAVNTKIFSERTMAQIDWAKTTVEVWDNGGGAAGTQLNGSYPDAFEGTKGWQVTCGTGWSAWVFKSTSTTGVDMSAFTGGKLHLAVKGSAPSVGIFVNSLGATATTVDLATLGYAADGAWHEMSIPLSSFGSIDLSQVSVYAGFAAPAAQGGEYAAGLTYIIDDLYFTP
jgi:hypothetical protein